MKPGFNLVARRLDRVLYYQSLTNVKGLESQTFEGGQEQCLEAAAMVILSCKTPKAWSSASSQGREKESLRACMGVIRVTQRFRASNLNP